MSKNKKSTTNGTVSPAASPVSSTSKKTLAPSTFWLAMAAILLATFLVYQPVQQAHFIWDDNIVLTENPLVQQPGDLGAIWFSTQPHDYFPLTLTMLWVEWRLFGLKPAGYLLMNVLQHALGAVLIWQVLKRLKIPAPWLIALLFALHPVAAGSVSWLAECKNTLSLLFYALTFFCYLEFESSNKTKWYALSLASFLCALLSKTSVVMLPMVLLGCVWWQRGKITARDISRTIPFFALSLALGLVTVWFQIHRAVGTTLSEVPNDPLLMRLVGGSWGLWFYLAKDILPLHLSVIYPRWEINMSSLLSYLPAASWLLALAATWHWQKKIGRGWFFALAYFTLMLLPVFGFVQMAYFMHSRVADHWQYLALIGPLALFVGGAAHLLNRQKMNGALAKGVAVAVAIAFALLTHQQAVFHADPALLWTETIRQNPDAWAAHNNLARLYAQAGDMEQAETHFAEAARLKPDSGQTRYNLGRLLLDKNQPEPAFTNLLEAVRLSPANSAAHFDLADAMTRVGKTNEAEAEFREVLRLTPDDLSARSFLGSLLAQMGKYDKSIEQFQIVAQAKPNTFDPTFNLGLAYFKKGQNTEAKRYFMDALQLSPDSISAHKKLGELFDKEGNKAEARAHLSKAGYLRGMDLARKGNLEAARDSFEEAIHFNPELVDAHYQLGLILSKQGKADEAKKEFIETLRLDASHSEARLRLQE